MATKTAGTLLTTTLTAVQFSHDPNALSNADLATIVEGIYRDNIGGDGGGNQLANILPGAFSRSGLLWLPGRSRMGPLQVHDGDWIAVDGFGNPFVIPRRALPTTLVINGTPVNGAKVMVMAASVRAAGWQVGTRITGANIPAGTMVAAISGDGLTVTMNNAATGSPGLTAVTAGTFTHS